ncbi:MAG: hypothetical protein MI806_34260 [Minwuiales bacterium]|nr:hypothetical protein [Minwuiales bacterium]
MNQTEMLSLLAISVAGTFIAGLLMHQFRKVKFVQKAINGFDAGAFEGG